MNKALVVGGLLLALLVPTAFAGSQASQATVLCVELQGNADTRYDVKARSSGKCARGERTVALPRGLRGPRGPRGASRCTGPCRPSRAPQGLPVLQEPTGAGRRQQAQQARQGPQGAAGSSRS